MFLFFVDAQLMNGDTCADRNFVVFFLGGGLRLCIFGADMLPFLKFIASCRV